MTDLRSLLMDTAKAEELLQEVVAAAREAEERHDFGEYAHWVRVEQAVRALILAINPNPHRRRSRYVARGAQQSAPDVVRLVGRDGTLKEFVPLGGNFRYPVEAGTVVYIAGDSQNAGPTTASPDSARNEFLRLAGRGATWVYEAQAVDGRDVLSGKVVWTLSRAAQQGESPYVPGAIHMPVGQPPAHTEHAPR